MYQRVHPRPSAAQAACDDLLTAAEVAALLRMTPGWVYVETRCNRIPHLRLGRYFRYRRSAIESWMGALEGGHELDLPTRIRPRAAGIDRDAADVADADVGRNGTRKG